MVDQRSPGWHRATHLTLAVTLALAGVGGGLDFDRGRRRSDPMVRARDVAWVVISAEGECDGRLLERERELERIGRRLQRARQGYGGALVVEGPAGIGKTVLLAAGRVAAQGEGFRVLRARGAELEREYAFGVVRQLFEPALAAATEQERAGLLDGPPGVAARLLSLPGLGDEAMGRTAVAPDPSFAVLHGLYWLCANLAAERPLALVVDDAHWADGASLRFLAFLLPRLEELPAAVLLGVRPAEAGPSEALLAALMMEPGTEVVTVGPLTVDGVATLVADGLGVEPDPAFAEACWEWLEDAFSIVDPTDVRWVFLSHDDADHTGNLAEVMTRCRNAILVCNWALVERFSNAFDFPLERCRWVDHGERFDVGDRALRAFRPPLYDSPATRGLLDERTGVYWAVDAFATPMPETVATIGDLDPEFWAQSNAMFVHHGLSPWVTLVDPDRYRKSVDQLQALSAKIITGAHNPVITAADIPVALGIMRGLPTADVPPPPDQAVLDVIVGHAAA
jgi:hypothetical protein